MKLRMHISHLKHMKDIRYMFFHISHNDIDHFERFLD